MPRYVYEISNDITALPNIYVHSREKHPMGNVDHSCTTFKKFLMKKYVVMKTHDLGILKIMLSAYQQKLIYCNNVIRSLHQYCPYQFSPYISYLLCISMCMRLSSTGSMSSYFNVVSLLLYSLIHSKLCRSVKVPGVIFSIL